MKESRSVLSYLSDDDLSLISEMSLGQRVRFLRERLNEAFDKEYSIHKVTERISAIGVSITPMGLSQLETGQITSPKAHFLMGIAKEFGVSMEFLLTGQRMEYDKKISQQKMEHPSIQHGVEALRELDEKDRQTILSIMSRLRMLKNLEASVPSLSG